MTNEVKQAATFVRRKINWFSVTKNQSDVNAALAKLRRGIGRTPGSMPEIWEWTLDGLPEGFQSEDGIPTKEEWAVHTALTLYALHQQGKDPLSKSMDRTGMTLGRAVRALIEGSEDEKRIKRRFDALATSSGIEEFSYHLRGMVQLLKGKDIQIDYSQLTEDLFWFQIPEKRDSLRLTWGQDYYSSKSRKERANEEQ